MLRKTFNINLILNRQNVEKFHAKAFLLHRGEAKDDESPSETK